MKTRHVGHPGFAQEGPAMSRLFGQPQRFLCKPQYRKLLTGTPHNNYGLTNEFNVPPYWKEFFSLQGGPLNLCYCDESGTGDQPIAVMAGILVDCQRMHITKKHWADLLERLSWIAGRSITEFHTREFYNGNGIWHGIDGNRRADIITTIFDWLAQRKHHVVYTSVCKQFYQREYATQQIPDELNTIWRFLGFHLILALQKYSQRESKTKGHTIFVFDNEKREELRFTDIIKRPPRWSDQYYERSIKQDSLDQIVDVPYFGDSQEVALVQVADVVSFFLRRYAEIKENLVPPKYPGEEQRIDGWISTLVLRSIGSACIYPKINRNRATDLFFRNASTSIRSLGDKFILPTVEAGAENQAALQNTGSIPNS
jgi:hypothetical protein